LNDCLACSGCVTTAESILIEQHSITDFLEKVKKYKCSIITISPQARSSLSLHFKMDDLQTHLALLLFFNKLGANYFFDQSFGIDIAQSEAQIEFVTKLKELEAGNKSSLPLLCSECPGWVCYAEKVVKSDAINHMSKVKSPQQILGNLLKEYAPAKLGLNREDIYHLSIQPCYDKKLEATRKEFESKITRFIYIIRGYGKRSRHCYYSW
jgi:iron only hydrogenase large subunit-like protein